MIKDGHIKQIHELGCNETIVVAGKLYLVSRGYGVSGGVAIQYIGEYDGDIPVQPRQSNKSISDIIKDARKSYDEINVKAFNR